MRERIRTDGPIPYGDVIEYALYDPEYGFYASGGQAGRRGDFITSPEVGPLFGALVAGVIDREWDRCGQPASFTVIDAGAGPGTLARSVLAAAPRCIEALAYVCVEVSEAQRQKHPDRVRSLASMPDGTITGLVIANELLDNLSFTPMRRLDGRWTRAMVTEVDGRLVESYVNDPLIESLGVAPFSPGADRGVLQIEAGSWLAGCRGMLERGRIIVIDYCRERSEEVEIRTYAGHGRGRDPLDALGAQDITVDVDLAQLQEGAAAHSIRSQTDWLLDHGLAALVEEGRATWDAGASVGDLAALKARSRVREAEALTDPAGLGSFTVAEWIV